MPTRILSIREVIGEGNLIGGTNPVAFTTTDPLRLWIIQFGTIVVMAQVLSLGVRRFRQPRVIAEVLGGILLGPTAFGRIPGFTENIFPPVSLPYLSLVANIGLCLFLFTVGLEIDTNIIKRNARISVIVSLAGIALPFGLGACLSIPLYHHFIDPSVHFTYFMLFTGVSYSITAFPVLCRILSELKLLDTQVGIVVLSAGVGNDIIGWTLLALSVALVNAGSGLSALWILLVCIAFAIFLLIPVKFVMRWLAHKTGSIENGPTIFYMTIVMILVWASGFFTDSIGVNALFGAFLAGLIIPREGGLAVVLTEKLEDMVSIVFLPLYFTISGLNTDLGLLDDGITWAFTIGIITLSFSGKFGGCTIASRFAGYGWRESSTIGALMSCKGLVELIVLNIGLQAGILSRRVFSMFVLEALALTFVTTPLVTALYPPERRLRVGATLPDAEKTQPDEKAFVITANEPWGYRLTVVLDKLDHIPGAMVLTQLLLPPRTMVTDIEVAMPRVPVSVDALQLIEPSDRNSTMMRSSVADSLMHTDPMLGIFRTFGELNEVMVTTSLSVVPYDDFARSVAAHAQRHASHLVLLPWLSSTNMSQDDDNPFDALFESIVGPDASVAHSQFVRSVFAESKTDVALFIDTGSVCVGGAIHIFLPFFGGPDDRLALEFVVQLCLNPRVMATVVRMVKRDESVRTSEGEVVKRPPLAHLEDRVDEHQLSGLVSPSMMSTIRLDTTVYGPTTSGTTLQSETADQITWSKYTSPNACTPSLRHALARIHFSDTCTSTPIQTTIQHARTLRETWPQLLIVTGRSRRLVTERHDEEMKCLLETSAVRLEGMRKTIGDVGAAVTMGMGGSTSAVVVVVQAGLE